MLRSRSLLMSRWRIGPKMRQWLITLLSTALLGILGAGAVAAYLPTQFTAQTTLFVYAHPGDSPEGGVRAEELALYRVRSYTPLITEPRVMSEVGNVLGLADTPQQLAARTDVENPLDTVLINISVTDSSPAQAARIANTIGAVFINTVDQLERPQRFDVQPHVAVKVVQDAPVPTSPSSLPLQVVLALGLLAGLSVGTIVTLGLGRITKQGGLSHPVAKAPEAAAQIAEPGSPLLDSIRSGQSSNNRSVLPRPSPRPRPTPAPRPQEAAVQIAEPGSPLLDPIRSEQSSNNGSPPGSHNV
jgi:capsular polysaccharide biosynthesis protein